MKPSFSFIFAFLVAIVLTYFYFEQGHPFVLVAALVNWILSIVHILNFLFTREMKFQELNPIKQWHTNSELRGDGKNVYDLPVSKHPQLFPGVHSVWYCKSLLARVAFLFSGKVSFVSSSVSHPPIYLGLGDYIRKKK
jgi:hypothetical protein